MGNIVFGGTIKGCTTSIGTVIGSAIVHGGMVGCTMVIVAIAGGATKGSTRLHHLLVHHHRQQNQWVCNGWVRNRELLSIRGRVAAELVTAKMEDGAALDVVTTQRSLMVSIFGDMRGVDDGT